MTVTTEPRLYAAAILSALIAPTPSTIKLSRPSRLNHSAGACAFQSQRQKPGFIFRRTWLLTISLPFRSEERRVGKEGGWGGGGVGERENSGVAYCTASTKTGLARS